MAITTLDGALAGMQPPVSFYKVIPASGIKAAGIGHSMLLDAGTPGAGAENGTLNGAALTTLSGQIPFTNPGSGNSYLARLEVEANQAGTLWLCDRLWHNGGYTITLTSIQSTTFPGLPARSSDGTANGADVQIAMEVGSATGNAAISNTVIGYTNQAGTASRVGTISVPASMTTSCFIPFNLQAGDTGVRSVQSMTLNTTYASGTVNLVAYRILAKVGCMLPNVGASIDLLTSGFPRLFDNTVPFLVFIPTATSASALSVSGHLSVSQG